MWTVTHGYNEDVGNFCDWKWSQDGWCSTIRIHTRKDLWQSGQEIGRYFVGMSPDLDSKITPDWLMYGKLYKGVQL